MSDTNQPDAFSHLPATLPRVLGQFDAIIIVVGSIIGSGVFLKASKIVYGDPTHGVSGLPYFGPIMGVWIVVGLLTLCGSLALAELAAMLPQAGGPYVYLREAYGRLPAFLWGWTEFWVIRSASQGALSCGTAIYLNEMISLRNGTPLSRGGQEVLAVSLIALMAAINIVGTRFAATCQNVIVVIKLGFLGIILLLPFLWFGNVRAETANLAPWWPESGAFSSLDFWRAVGLAMIAVMWPYNGWTNIAPVAEEIREPERNVPRALGIGMLIIILVYVGAQISYHLILPMQKIGASQAVVSDVFKVMFGTVGGQFAALGVLCSMVGAAHSNLLTGPRIFFAMARDGLLPKSIHRIHNSYRTPINAILLQAAWSIVLVIVVFAWKSNPNDRTIDAFDELTDFVIFGGSIFYAMAVAAVFVLRAKLPDLPRPYRTWGYPITPGLYLLMFGGVLVSLLIDKWQQSAAGLLLIGAGAVFYALTNRRGRATAD